MVKLDPTVLDLVEQHPTEWVVRVDGYWGKRGMVSGVTPRWYFQKGAGKWGWWCITEAPEADNWWGGRIRAGLEPNDPPFRFAPDPVPTGELVHISCAPTDVQMWVAGFYVDIAESGREYDRGGKQADLRGWA